MFHLNSNEFCGKNVTFAFTDRWWQSPAADCMFGTVRLVVLFVFLATFGCGEFLIYYKYGTPASRSDSVRRCSPLYFLQLFSLWLVVIANAASAAVTVFFDSRHVLYPFMILNVVVTAVLFTFSAVLLRLERLMRLPSVPSHGHGAVLLIFWSFAFCGENLKLLSVQRIEWWRNIDSTKNKLNMAVFGVEYFAYLLVFVLGLKAPGLSRQRRSYSRMDDDDEHASPPIVENDASTFRNFNRKIRILLSIFLPNLTFWLKVRILVCFLLLVFGRVINVFVPIYSKLIVDSLTRIDKHHFDYVLVVIFVALKFCQGAGPGSMGFINNLRSFLWIRVQQYTTKEVELRMFEHLHDLSLRYHLSRKTGETIRIMDRGTDSINNLVTYIVFSIFPTILDILVAVIFFLTSFNIWFGSIVLVTMILYISVTIAITEWRTKFQRQMNVADNEQKTQSVDSLLNYETVKFFNAEEFELDSYRNRILNYQREEYKNSLTLNVLNTVQNAIISIGFFVGAMLCIRLVNENRLTIGDYVLFGSYIIQLYVPLNWLGTFYRTIQKNFIDMENMIELLDTTAEVQDVPNAATLVIKRCAIEFKNVSFGYSPERLVLKNITFNVAPGSCVALVGPSGSGKTTIIRLLFRFFDVENGEILIDGHNIKMVKLRSLRKAIGVVPQDTVLLNNSILYNIRYGRRDATDAEVVEAARHAELHESVMNFTEKYETKVGERGLRLSGGEKQRVGIARTILKAPSIMLLDEATSALDTQTERNIQATLNQVCVNRTTIIVAHRLSTIIHADEILVLREGEIIERGTHAELVSKDGFYSHMWNQQLQNGE